MPEKHAKQVIIGAKNCDLMPLKVHQKMFLEREFVDPFYKQRLAATVIISADCPKPEKSCFCNLLGLTPYPENDGDINLSVLEDGFLVEPLSVIGRELVFGRDKPFRPATDVEVDERDRLRRDAVAQLKEINPKPWRKDLPDAIEQKKDERFWRDASRDCVECYGCLTTCPTCFCYLLYDQTNGETPSPKSEARNLKVRRCRFADPSRSTGSRSGMPATIRVMPGSGVARISGRRCGSGFGIAFTASG